jgi:hypothetical protein
MATALTGPYGCEGARGSIGGLTMTQDRKAGTVLKRKPQPTNPQSVAQMGNRHMFGFVGGDWANISAQDKATWESIAQSQQISEFAAYTQKNAQRWQQGKPPTMANPAAEAETPTASGTLTVTNRTGAADTASFSFTAAATDWGVIFYRGTDGNPTGVKSEVIAVRRCTQGAANVIDVDHDGADGDIIKVAVFTVDGVRSALKAPS